MPKIEPKVYIIDDDTEWCTSLKWLLHSVKLPTEFYYDGQSFIEAYKPAWRGCILLDIRMPGMSGLQVQDQLNKKNNQMPIIIISGHADVPMAIRAMKAGAFDLITKPINEEQLLELIYQALERDKKHHAMPERSAVLNRYGLLTAREREIMGLVIAGKLSKQIAADLNISVKTVELHRSNLMHKLEVKNTVELMRAHFLMSEV